MNKRWMGSLLAVGLVVVLAAPGTSQGASAWQSRSTTLTGSFVVGQNIRTIKAETRTRSVVSVPTNGDVYSVGLNPNELTVTVMVCNQNGCDQPANRLCIAPATLEDTGNEVSVSSTQAGCRVEIVADVGNYSVPRVLSDGSSVPVKVEQTAATTFRDGARIQGQNAAGSDGRVARIVGWGYFLVPTP